MKPQTRRQRFQQHIERLRELGKQDAARRCDFCKRALPPTGVHVLLASGKSWQFCGQGCLASHEDLQQLGLR